jgi:hypothetical protein
MSRVDDQHAVHAQRALDLHSVEQASSLPNGKALEYVL